MTTNDATAREAIAEVLSIEKRRPHTRQMIDGITALLGPRPEEQEASDG